MKESKELTPAQVAGLKKLREPFFTNQISKLPKPTKKQTDEVKADFRKGVRCQICGGWHHKDVIHLDYVGHAALTDRLLDCDPLWNWEPMALDATTNLPLHVKDGLWINLTVCGVTRLGFGDAQGKTGPNAIKEMIGDALRNAAMRFGAALDLWHKGDLHVDEEAEKVDNLPEPEEDNQPEPENRYHVNQWLDWIDGFVPAGAKSVSLQNGWDSNLKPNLNLFPEKHQNELEIAFKSTLALLEEKEIK